MEKSTPVETILVDYQCDVEECNGIVEYKDGKMLMSNPPRFEHRCNSCNKKYTFFHKYPYTKYVT